MGYINKNLIRIFPTSERTAENRAGTNWLTEYNIASIVNQLTGCNGFVTFPAYGKKIENVTSKSEEEIKFNIGGYYFETTVGAIETAIGEPEVPIGPETTSYIVFTNEGGNRKATIKLADAPNTGDISYRYLIGKDGGDDTTEGEELPSLTLYDATGNIPQESRLNIAGFSRLDDGVLG